MDADVPKVSVRLVGGLKPNQGVVEVFSHGIWGQVASLTARGASVVCKQLGLGNRGTPVATPVLLPAVSKSAVVWSDGDWCKGNETDFLSCSNEPSGYDTNSPIYQVSCYNASYGEQH